MHATNRKMALKCALFMTVMTAGAMAVPYNYGDSTYTCATSCPEATKFMWEAGHTYEYQYESDIKTHIAGVTEEHSSLHIRATALIEVLAPCEMALRLSDVTLEDSLPSQYDSRQQVEQSWEFKKSLQERSMRFALLDGKVESVCAEPGDETWVVNIKKGIVSAFQNTQTRLDASTVTVETDVAGSCPVEYEVQSSSWSTTTIKKTKDLLGCTERMGHLTAFQATPYKVESAIQSLPLMKSTHECTQQVKDGILEGSSCTELHVLRPFSRDNNGAVTEVSYKLEYLRTNAGVSTQQGSVGVRSSLLFEHEVNTEEMMSTAREAQQTMTKLCRKSADEITPDVPRLFKELVHQMRRLDSRTLQDFYSSASSLCSKSPKFIRDAVPVLGTSASVTLIRDLILAGQVSDTEADIWLTSMAFIASPTKDMLKQLKPLLTSSQNIRKSVLSISTLVHSYCRDNTNCATESEVTDIIRTLEDNLHYNCKAESDEQHDLILMSLKGLGNTGHAVQAVPTLNRCFKNQELPTEIRVAALEAFRRMACLAEMSEVKELLNNNIEDSELRIHAYLTLMHCPTTDSLKYVENILSKEEVNQVGSFIWTHMTNMMETSNPHKQGVRNIVENITLQKRFNMDKRKFSRNLEWSAFSHLINAGGMVESNLIWSENSFVPRSASLNLTVDMFGESVNLLEIGARVQGLEKTLETLFAEQDNTVERQKRSTDALANIDRMYDCKRDAAQASYFVRVFGNEIRYDDLHDFDLTHLKDKMNYLDWLIELSKEHSVEMTRTMMFLDATTIIPTAAGLPLKLSVDGTSSINVNVNGKLDIRQMFSSLSTFDIDGTIKPSASMEVNSEMGVDAHVARTGLKMQTTLHTSTVAKGKIQMQDGKIFNLDITTPQDNTQVLNANNKFYVVYQNSEREQQMLSDERIQKTGCTSSKFATVTGLELCGEVSLPWAENMNNVPWFALWGPASANIIMNKKDSHDNYVMEVKYVTEKARRNGAMAITDIARFYVNTPGSRINRQVLVDFTVDRAERQVSFNMDTPWKKATLQSGLTNTAEMKRVFTTATLDGKTEYSINAEVAIDEKSFSVQYTPMLEINIPGMDKILFNGDIKHRPGKKGVFTMALKNVFEEPLKASGSIVTINEANKMRYETDMEFSSHILNGKLMTFVDNTKDKSNAISSKFDLEYTYKKQPQQSIKFEETYEQTLDSDASRFTLDSTWSSTFMPRYDGDINAAYSQEGATYTSSLNAGFDQTRRVIYSEVLTLQLPGQVDGEWSFKLPYKNLDYYTKFNFLKTDDELKFTSTGKRDNIAEGNVEVILKRLSTKPLHATADAKLTYPGREMALTGSVQETAVNVYKQNLNIQLQKYQNIDITSVYKMEPRHEFTTDIALPDIPTITVKGHLKPDLKNLEAHAEVTYDSRTYLADTNWSHRGSSENFNTRAEMMVSYPERSISAQGSSVRQGSEITTTFETKWDANSDDTKRFTMSSKVNIEPTTPALELQINTYPQHFITLKTNGKYETEGWYKTTSDVQGSLSLKTSFKNVEDINVAFVHDRTKKLYKNSAEVSWKKGQQIAGNVNIKKIGSWANCEIQAEVTTPFRGAKTMGTEVTYNLQDTTFSTNIKAKLEDKQITLGFDGELNMPQHVLTGELTFTTPFRNFEAITASVRHNDNGQTYQSNIAMSWAPNKQITADFNMNNQGTSAVATNSGEVMISTPFRGFQQAKTTWQHEHNSNKMTNVAHIEHEGQSVYNHNVVVNTKKTNKKLVIDVQASLKSAKTDDITISLNYAHDRQTMETIKSDCSVTWAPSKTITLSYDIDMSGNNILATTVKVMSPFKGFEDLSLVSMTTKDRSSKLVSANEFKWANNKKINFDSEVTNNGYELQGKARFTSPFYVAENIVVNAKNQQQDGIWVSHADIDYGKKIEIDTEFSNDWKKMVSVNLKSACPVMKNLYAKLEMNGDLHNFAYNVEVNHEKLDKKITLSGLAKTVDINDITVSADLSTPFTEMTYLKTAVNYKMEGGNIHVDAMIEHPQYKGKVTEDIQFRASQFVNTKTLIEYKEGKTIQLTTELNVLPTISGKIMWKSPFEKFEDINLVFNHEGSLKSFTSTGELSYSPGNKINVNANFNMDGNAIHGRAQLTTPFNEINRMVITMNHDGSMTDFKNDASFELNTLRVSGKSEFQLNGNSMTLKAELQTPIESYETITVELSHKGPITNFNNNVLLTLGNRQISGNSKLRLRGSSLTGNMALETPFKSLRDLSLDVDHTGSWKQINNKITVVYNSKKIISKTTVNLSGTTLNGKIFIKTPFADAKSMSMEINHEGPKDNFKNNAVISLNNKDVTANSEFTMSSENLALKAAINLPIRTVKKLSIDVTHQGPMTNFNNNAVLRYNNKKVTASSQLSLSEVSVNAKANMDMPTGSLAAEFNHDGAATDFTNNVLLSYNEDSISGDCQFKLKGSKLMTKTNLATPWAAMSGELNHNGPVNNFNNNFVVKYNEHISNGESEFKLNGNKLSAKANFACPGSSMSAELNHNGPVNNFRNNVMIKYMDHITSGESEFRLDGNTLITKATFACPGSSMSAELNHNGPINEFTNNLILKYNNKEMTGSSEFKYNDNTLLAKGDMATPHCTMSIEVNHNGPADNFKNDLAIIVNRESYKAESQFSKTGNKMNGKFSLTCPTRSVSAEFKHRGKLTNFANDMTLVYSDKIVKGNSQFRLSGNRVSSEAAIELPEISMKISATHDGPANNFKNEFMAMYNNKQIEISSELKLSGNELKLKGSLNAPFDNAKSASIQIEHMGPLDNFNNNAVFHYNEKQVTGDSQFSLTGNKLRSKATLMMPEHSFSGEMNHNGPLKNFNNNGEIIVDGHKMSASSVFNLNENSLTGKATLEVPQKTMVIEVNHNGPSTNFVSDAKASYNGNQASGNLQFSLEANNLSTKGTLNIPIKSGQQMSFEVNHKGPIDNFSNDASFVYGGDEMSCSTQMKFKNNKLNANAELRLPSSSIRNIAVEVTHNGPARNFENTAKLTIDERSVSGSSQFELQGTTMTAKANLKSTYGMAPITLELYHSGPVTKFTNNGVFTYGRKQVAGNSEFQYEDNTMNMKAQLQNSFCCMEPLSIEITHTGSANNFRNSGNIKYGTHDINVNNEFDIGKQALHWKSGLQTNIGDLKPISLEVNHDGPMTAFNNNALVSYGDDNISGTSEFSLQGTSMHVKATAQTTIGQVKPMLIEINHSGPMDNFENDITMSYGNKEISSELKMSIEGNMISGDMKLQTPFKEVEKLIAKINHNGKNWRNFENSGIMKLNNKKYTAESQLRWFGKIFKLTAEVNAPEEYSIKVNHKGARDDFSNNMKIKIPGDKISGTSSFKVDGTNIEGKANLETTFKSFSAMEVGVDHKGDSKKFLTSVNIQTPFKGYKSFSGDVNHEGDLNKFRTTGKLSLPFKKLSKVETSVSHECSSNAFQTEASASYDDKTITGTMNFKKTPRKLMSTASLQTPFPGYENFVTSLEHTGNTDNFQTNCAFTSSIPGYDKFTGSLTHSGDMTNFITSGKVSTPIADYNNFEFNVEHSGNKHNFKTAGAVTTSVPGYEKFGGSTEYSYDGNALHYAASAHTPFNGYDEFGLNVDHTGSKNNFKTSAAVTTPIRNYRNFGVSVNHNGDLNTFRSGVEATSSMRGYDKFGANIEKKGSLNDFEVSADVQTPFKRYENFGALMKHVGDLTNFRTSGHVTTSIPGYDRFSGSLNHNGGWRRFTTSSEVRTPVHSHETYSMNIDHSAENGISTNADFEYPGKKYDFSLNHQGTSKNFNSRVEVNTPHAGYDKFGLTVAHNGDFDDFTQSGTINLPFRQLPEIKYSISHKGHLKDFASSASVEYNNEKISGNGNFQKALNGDETTYRSSMQMTSTYAGIRDLQMTGNHVRKPVQKSGMLDITHNGQKKIDIDYDYTTSGPKTINIKIRNPQPFETSINFNGDGTQFTGDALLKWNKMFTGTVSGEFSLKNLPNDREFNLKMIMPSRVVSVKSGYTLTGDSLTHRTDLQWGNEESKKMSYNLEASKSSRRSQSIIDGRFNIQSARVTGEITVNHVCNPGHQYTTEVAIQTNKRMSVKSDLTIDTPRFTHILTVEHPDIKKGASLKVEGLMTATEYDGKVELQYNREVITYTGRISDESNSRDYKYVSSSSLAHPTSGLDFQFSSTVENNDEMSSAYMETKYLMASDRQYRIASTRAEINKIRKELNIEMVNPLDTIRISGRQVTAANGVYQYTAEATCDHNTIRGELSLTKAKSADLKVYYNDNDFLQATAKAGPQQLKADVFRMVSGQKIQEASVLLKKDDERIVTGKSYWRPRLYSDIRAAMQTTNFGRRVKANWDILADAVQQEYAIKMDYLKKNAKPMYKAVMSIKSDIVSTYQSVKADVIDMYNNNEFYMKDICQWMKQTAQWTRTTYARMGDSAKVNYTRAQAVVARSTRSVEDITSQAWTWTQTRTSHLSDWFSNVQDRIQNNARALAARVRDHPSVRKAMNKVRNSSIMSTWMESQGDAAATSGSAPSMWDQLMKRDDVQTGISYVKTQVTNSDVAAKYFEIKKTIDGITSDIHQNGLKTIRANIEAWLKDYLKTDKDRFTVGDGDVEFSLYVPLPMDDLRAIPKVDINLSKYLRQAKNMYNNYVPNYDWTFSDYYYNYKPSSNLKEMVPPFPGHATIAGNQHYMTFDKKFYEFAGECSYLLARDFIDGTFSVIVDYERTEGRPAKKSITVTSNDKTIVISRDGRVLMDNSRVEMPIQVEGTTIVREENQIRVDNKNGISIICDLAHDQCTVEVSGWYYSKTGGLFGTYNNEQVDDFTTADHRRVENTGEFASSWAVGSSCRPTNGAVDVSNEVYPGTRTYDICAKYFEADSSPLRKGFKVVDPEPFMKMCLNDISTDSNRMATDEDICNTAAFYVSECQRAEVPVKVPSMCVRCEMETGRIFSEGQNVTIKDEEVPNTADIVFVIHHSECNKMMLDNLKSMVDDLDKVFKTEELVNNRYSIIGYGGEGVESTAHIHTMDGQVFATRDKILLGLENFHTTSGDSEDAMAAVKYAANLPFRAGVSKNIILLPCAACRQGAATFSELQQILLFRDINFHVMMQYNFLFKGNKDAGTAFIFGVDRETVYTRKDAGTTELVGDPEIRSQILMPKDLCVALSEETDGSVFNTLQFINSRPFIQKRFMDVLVRVIADKAEPSDCQICECAPDSVGAGKADCRHCVRPDPIYNLMPHFDSILLPPPAVQMPEIPKVKPEPSPVKPPKTKKAKKNKKQLNAKKRAMRERRLRRLQQQN